MQGFRPVQLFVAANALLAIGLIGLGWTPATVSAEKAAVTLQGTVQSGGIGLVDYSVSLYVADVDHEPGWTFLGADTSAPDGSFVISYSLPPRRTSHAAILFVQAERGPVLLTSAIGLSTTPPGAVVVNERTTVATGNAFAQFVDGRQIAGNTYGMLNAVAMAANFANPGMGEVGLVLDSSPNGTETSTLATFNALSNAVASCVADADNCTELFRAATPPGRGAPTNVLQAIANIVKNPAYPEYPLDDKDPVFQLSLLQPIYQPALPHRPTSWLLFLKITGGFYSKQDSSNLLNGPGNFAIDRFGFVWVNTNYQPEPPSEFACAGDRLIKFYPWGEPVPGTPFTGGGLSGAGWGNTLDPKGTVWIGNFGFQDPPCQLDPSIAAPSNSVSRFRPDGTPISGPDGYTQGNISWPMGTVSDHRGNIWVANCGNDSVTKIPQGDPTRAINIPLGPTPPDGDPQIKPFGAVIDADGNLWTANNRSNTVSIISPENVLIDTLPGTYNGKTILSHPIGNTLDSKGNVWVANSDWLDAPCPTKNVLGTATNPSITLFQAKDRTPHPGSPFSGGGVNLPWGIAVDGDDTVWVFNFGTFPPAPPGSNPSVPPPGISRFCGTDTTKCPPGMQVGDPISPDTGYRTDALQRITAGAVDPSGNIWITVNWKIDANPEKNPGGNAVVIAVGAAAPVKTPVIGPPVPFN
jgi:sugar lactone lactonase YvrE